MTEIRHTDRRGKVWAFVLDCNGTQERMFRRLLSLVHNLGAREELTINFHYNAAANARFMESVEAVVLSALERWASDAIENTNGAQEPRAVAEDEEAQEGYYWENF